MSAHAWLLAASLSVIPQPGHSGDPQHIHHHVAFRTRSHIHHARAQSVRDEKALQGRVMRMARLAVLVRREALLHDFLTAARTETPLLRDDARRTLPPGIEISTSTVTLDFLGSPVVRARVTSRSPVSQTFVLIADLVDTAGTRGRIGVAIALQPGETRIVELLCPSRLRPVSLIWSSAPL
jgi:hypothetical protein